MSYEKKTCMESIMIIARAGLAVLHSLFSNLMDEHSIHKFCLDLIGTSGRSVALRVHPVRPILKHQQKINKEHLSSSRAS